MKDIQLLQNALMLTSPWQVVECKLDADRNWIDIFLTFTRDSRFTCPVCGKTDCEVYDTRHRSWRHLNLFRHQAHLHYVSVFVDLDQSRVIYATEGKDHKTVEAFKTDFCEHHGIPEKVTDVSCDMSPAFIKGVTESLPNANITFDRFHVVKILNEAVDEVRRQEQKETSELKNTRYIFLKNPENLTRSQTEKLEKLKLKNQNLKTMRAYQIRLNFQEFWNQPEEEAEGYLKRWYFWATHTWNQSGMRQEPSSVIGRGFSGGSNPVSTTVSWKGSTA